MSEQESESMDPQSEVLKQPFSTFFISQHPDKVLTLSRYTFSLCIIDRAHHVGGGERRAHIRKEDNEIKSPLPNSQTSKRVPNSLA